MAPLSRFVQSGATTPDWIGNELEANATPFNGGQRVSGG
jgi:hypothetical protein